MQDRVAPKFTTTYGKCAATIFGCGIDSSPCCVHDEEPGFLQSPSPGAAAFIESPPVAEQPRQSIGAPNPETALLWLRRARNSLGHIHNLQERRDFWSVGNLLTVLLAWLCAFVVLSCTGAFIFRTFSAFPTGAVLVRPAR